MVLKDSVATGSDTLYALERHLSSTATPECTGVALLLKALW